MSASTLSPRESGQSLEQLLGFSHQLYRDQGLALIEHNGTRGRIVKRGGVLAMIPTGGGSAPDYYGSAAGQMIAFDAKRVSTKSGWQLPRKSLHQLHKLQDWARFGAISFFAVEERRQFSLWLLRITGEESPFVLPSIRFNRQPHPALLKISLGPELWYDWLPAVVKGWWRWELLGPIQKALSAVRNV